MESGPRFYCHSRSKVDLGPIFGNHPLFQEVVRGEWSPTNIDVWSITFNKDDISSYQWSTGVSFMQDMKSKMENHRTHLDGRNSSYRGGIDFHAGSSHFHFYTKFLWSGENGDELFIDNAGAYIPTDCKFLIRQELAHRIKWILRNEDGTNSLGPNLICKIYTPTLPDLNASKIYKDVQLPGTSVGVMFAKFQGYCQFSRHANWRFVNLNSAYNDMVPGKARTLFVYSDVCKRSVVGNQETDFFT